VKKDNKIKTKHKVQKPEAATSLKGIKNQSKKNDQDDFDILLPFLLTCKVLLEVRRLVKILEALNRSKLM